LTFPTNPVNREGPFPFGPAPERIGAFTAWALADGLIRNFTYLGRPDYNSLSTLGIEMQGGNDGPAADHYLVVPGATADRIGQSLALLSVNNPYALAGFLAQGKKLILWHGTADGLLTPFNTIKYYQELAALRGGYDRLQRNVKLFMAPDVGHCYGGAGPNAFQTLYHKLGLGELPPPIMDSDHDMLMALEAWVERDVEPRQIIASRYQDDDYSKRVVRTMPLCPFPAMARYDGHGDANLASSWSCPKSDERLLKVGRFGATAGALR
jgi:feruloyl esterase